ncbi:unnamed protein product [Chrysoparadoxa australica]
MRSTSTASVTLVLCSILALACSFRLQPPFSVNAPSRRGRDVVMQSWFKKDEGFTAPKKLRKGKWKAPKLNDTPTPLSSARSAKPAKKTRFPLSKSDQGPSGLAAKATVFVQGLQRRLEGAVAWPVARTYIGGVATGLGLATAVIVGPSGLGEDLQQSITLFENILVDIDRGFVEQVDVPRLFETAVVSMLGTLDPYTEYENNQQAASMKEVVSGRYGGVGLVIAGGGGASAAEAGQVTLPGADPDVDGREQPALPGSKEEAEKKKPGIRDKNNKGVTVVAAFEGYAFDSGLRVGDTITAVNGESVKGKSVDQVRDLLRGPADTTVPLRFIREAPGLPEGEVTLVRRQVRLRDVKLSTLVGRPEERIGYIQLSGFSAEAGQEVANAYTNLGLKCPGGLKTLILDLRGNPGGLLEGAVDISQMFVPQGSTIVSARGRAFGSAAYRSRRPPIRSQSTQLIVLTNGGTASAAEIVAGAIQDTDSGVIIGTGNGRTYGKGLVQNVAGLPYGNALKLTVAKYYTPSGRCIQSVNYKEGGVSKPGAESSKNGNGTGPNGFLYEATEINDKDRKTFKTRNGREVKDGGGIQADVKVSRPKPSMLEYALLQQGAYFDFASQWARSNVYTDGQKIDTDSLLPKFQAFVASKQAKGEYNLEAAYTEKIQALAKVLKDTGLKDSARKSDAIGKEIAQELTNDFGNKKESIKDAIGDAILSRYLPESQMLKMQLDRDPEYNKALEIARNPKLYAKILASPGKAERLGSGRLTRQGAYDVFELE